MQGKQMTDRGRSYASHVLTNPLCASITRQTYTNHEPIITFRVPPLSKCASRCEIFLTVISSNFNMNKN